MTWEELKEEAKKMGYCQTQSSINQNGKMVSDESMNNEKIQVFNNGMLFGQQLSYDQMFAIMKALQ